MKYVGPLEGETPDRRLAIHLLMQGFADPDMGQGGMDLYTNTKSYLEGARWQAIKELRLGRQIRLAITHAGAVRRAELEQQLQTGRIKEPMGLIWDGRHFKRDTRIALLDVTNERPLVVVYVDLNDVKLFNKRSHAVGDAAIRRYLEIIADVAAGGDAYRLSGGADEVVILLPRFGLERALETVRMLLNALGRERVEGYSLRAAAGVVVVTSTVDVDELKGSADREQGRAKDESRRCNGRPSVLAWELDKLEVIALPKPQTITERLMDAMVLIEQDADAPSVADVLDSVPFEDWESFVGRCLREKHRAAVKLLRWTAQSHADDGSRFNAIRILQENSLLDEEFQRELLQRERDPEILELLSSPRG